MSRLELYNRPLVAFDATNKQHRRYWYNFVKNNGWGTCPVRFIVPEATGVDLPAMVQRELMNYYVDREFTQPEPAVKPKVRAQRP